MAEIDHLLNRDDNKMLAAEVSNRKKQIGDNIKKQSTVSIILKKGSKAISCERGWL